MKKPTFAVVGLVCIASVACSRTSAVSSSTSPSDAADAIDAGAALVMASAVDAAATVAARVVPPAPPARARQICAGDKPITGVDGVTRSFRFTTYAVAVARPELDDVVSYYRERLPGADVSVFPHAPAAPQVTSFTFGSDQHVDVFSTSSRASPWLCKAQRAAGGVAPPDIVLVVYEPIR